MNPPGTNDTETRHPAGASAYPAFRAAVREAVAFWEKGRLIYGCILLLVTIVRVIHFWPVSEVLYTDNLGGFIAAILIANFFYCFAYLVELFVLIPILRPFRHRIRVIVFVLGTILASTFAVVVLDHELLRPPYID